MAELTDAKRRILDRLKRADTLTAPEVAAAFSLTDTAVRQHLEALEQAGLVERTSAPRRAVGARRSTGGSRRWPRTCSRTATPT